MGLLTTLLSAPVAGPAKGAWWLAQRLHEAALAERDDPASIRAALADLERRLDAGEIDEPAFEAEEERLLDRLEAIQSRRQGQ
jgi:hypothetical protein